MMVFLCQSGTGESGAFNVKIIKLYLIDCYVHISLNIHAYFYITAVTFVAISVP